MLARPDAELMVIRYGGRVMRLVNDSTTLLVVGQGDLPLSRSGRFTRNLRVAQSLQRDGAALIILDEYQFLNRIRGGRSSEAARRSYCLAELSHIIGVRDRILRTWVRCGLLQPTSDRDGFWWFDYTQISVAKAMRRLQQSSGFERRFRTNLQKLAKMLPTQAALFHRLITAETNGPLLWRNAQDSLTDATGQFHFDFGDDAPLEAVPFRSLDRGTDWFARGVRAEDEGRLEEAEDHYRFALELGLLNADVHFNLGNVLVGLSRFDEAANSFREVIRLDPNHAEAWNNLGVALGEMNSLDQACAAFREALRIVPSYADALYNLADGLDLAGRTNEAEQFWRSYLDKDHDSPWSQFARLRIVTPSTNA